MNLTFTSRAWAEYIYWQETDQKVVERINALIKDTARSPFTGIGKPEPLKNEFRVFGRAGLTKSIALCTASLRTRF